MRPGNVVVRIALGLAIVASIVCGGISLQPDEAHAQAPDREFTIAVGETLTFDASGIRNVTIGLSKVADVKRIAEGRQLAVVGQSRGVTTINIYSRKGQKTLLVRVVDVNPVWLSQVVRKVLGKGSGVDVRVVKGRVLLEGEVTSKTFQKKIKRLTELYPNQVLNFTTFREAFVEGAKMVSVDIHFLQLSTTNQDQVGVHWGQFIGANLTGGTGDVPLYYGEGTDLQSGVTPGQTSSQPLTQPVRLTGGSGFNTFWSLVGDLNATLDFLASHGMIKTMRRGKIITEGGTPGKYHTGGTLLVKLEGFNSAELRRVPFGMDVKVTPIVDYKDQVKLEIEIEVSEIDQSLSVGNLPGLRDTDVQATVNMQEGQSVLLTSQNNEKNTSSREGWWMLSRIPIVGWLFKGRSYTGDELNNAIFVTPRVYDPSGSSHRTLVQGVFKDLLDAGFKAKKLPEVSNEGGEGGGSTSSSGDETSASQSTSP
jgi:Flp pilus assembly secretin CpaC